MNSGLSRFRGEEASDELLGLVVLRFRLGFGFPNGIVSPTLLL
jgi:hypothetical protein